MCRRPKHNWPVVSRCDGSPLRLRVRNVQREHFEYEIRSIPCFASQNDRAEPTLFQFIFIYQQRGDGAMAHNVPFPPRYAVCEAQRNKWHIGRVGRLYSVWHVFNPRAFSSFWFLFSPFHSFQEFQHHPDLYVFLTLFCLRSSLALR